MFKILKRLFFIIITCGIVFFIGYIVFNDGRYRCVYATNYSACLKKLNDALSCRDRYLSSIKFFAWLDDWYENFKRPNVKESTLCTIDVILRVHVKSKLKNVLLRDVNGLLMQKFLLGIEKSRTRKAVYDVLCESFKKAFALRLIEFDPMLAVEIPTHKQIRGSQLTPEELCAFFKSIVGHHVRPYFLFLLYTGCRRGEALSVRWSDVDFEKSLLHIPGSKTDLSNRIIPLFDNVSQLLSSMSHNTQYIFNYRPDYVTHVFKEKCPSHKLHDLRHTFASMCLEKGVEIRVVQGWLGHSKLDTTTDIYMHVSKSLNFQEAEKMRNAFSFD